MDLALVCLLSFLTGLALYALDVHVPSLYRGWYNFWHKTKLAADSDDGFVANRPFTAVLFASFMVAVVAAIVMGVTGTLAWFVALVDILPATPCILAGSYAYHLVMKAYKNRNKVAEAAKKFDITTTLKKDAPTVETPPVVEEKRPTTQEARKKLDELGL